MVTVNVSKVTGPYGLNIRRPWSDDQCGLLSWCAFSPAYVRSQAISSFSRTVPQRTEHARQSTFFSVKYLHSSLQICDRRTALTSIHLTSKYGA